jgi:hydrogenase expression/formation protein HypD
MVLRQLEAGRYEVENQYGRSVSREGNLAAQRVLAEVFAVRDRPWRGIGVLPASGLVIREHLAAYDAERKFAVESITVRESEQCKSGSVLQGLLKPDGCPAFGRECTPEHPLGATMVSGEGACAAYYKYHRTSHA